MKRQNPKKTKSNPSDGKTSKGKPQGGESQPEHPNPGPTISHPKPIKLPRKKTITPEKERSNRTEKKKPNRPEKKKPIRREDHGVIQLPIIMIFEPSKMKEFSSERLKKLQFPYNETKYATFYPEIEVPITLIKAESLSNEILLKFIDFDEESDVFVDMINLQDGTQMLVFCSERGVLLIEDPDSSDILPEFLEQNQFYSKGQNSSKLIQEFCDCELIDIEKEILFPKQITADIKELQNLYLPKTQFKQDICNNIPICALKIYSIAFEISTLFMLLPIIQEAPMQVLILTTMPKKLQLLSQMPFKFKPKDKTIPVSYIPSDDDSLDILGQAIEEIYDGKSYVFDFNESYFGYGTKNGIVITDSEIFPFFHAKLEIQDPIDEDIIQNLIKAAKWKDKSQMPFAELVSRIYYTLKTTENRSDDNPQPVEFPEIQLPNPATFVYPPEVPRPPIQSQFTIISLPINPQIYIRFSYPILCLIRKLQKLGFTIPQAADYNIEELYRNYSNKEYHPIICALIQSFPKVDSEKIISLLKDITPLSTEENTIATILKADDLTKISRKVVKQLLPILDRVFKSHNNLIKQLSSTTSAITPELNQVMLNLLFSIQPSRKIKRYVASLQINPQYPTEFEKMINNLTKFLDTVKAKKQIELQEQLNRLHQLLKEYFVKNVTNMQIQLIYTAINNLKYFDEKSQEAIDLFVNDAIRMIEAASTYINFCNTIAGNDKYQNSTAIKAIEDLLFQLVFTPSDDHSPSTQVYSVYQMHNTFLFNTDPIVNFKSSTGSGKTRCSPFFFAIKALMDNMQRPFFIMTQPGSSIIDDKMKDFKKTLEDTVILVRKVDKLLELYQTNPTKPVISLLSPQNALMLLIQAEKSNIDIISKTRFCLDEVHERTVFTDVLIAKLSQMINDSHISFPLQVLMMSATPDERILHCFGTVKMWELPDSQLFPIDTLQLETDKIQKISGEAVKQSIEILTQMANKKKERGHILIFTSGNARINEIISSITKTIKDNKAANIKLIEKISLTNKKEFDLAIDRKVKKDNRSLFVVLIPFAGYAPLAQKEIAKQIIPNHENVIKVIIATNAIESSITIDKLAAVVDTGRFNRPLFDIQRGITLLSEEPISKQSRIQRKGRVGRVMPGTSVQISVKGETTVDHLPPEIQTIDISSSILTLRKMGIKLEFISNLPDPIDDDNLEQILEDLYKIKALDRHNTNITKTGIQITLFETISPFLAASIIQVSKAHAENQLLFYLLGSLIVLIFSSNDLVTDVFAEPLQKNFHDDSDIITLLKTFLQLVTTEKSIKLSSQSYGLNPKIVKVIKSATETIAANFEVSTDEKSIFMQLNELLPQVDLMSFIQDILDTIENYKVDWIKCRRCVFHTITNILSDPRLIYIGDGSLGFQEGAVQSEISLSMRPGGKGFVAPGEAYIFSISHNKSLKINFGSCIHRNLKPRSSVIGPRACEAQRFFIDQDDFSRCLLNSYLKGKESYFVPLNNLAHTGNSGSTTLFFQLPYLNKTIITFVPTTANAERYFQSIVSRVTHLMPYTPSMVLLRNSDVGCAIGINFVDFNKPEGHIYFFDDNNYHPYPINETTLEYLFHNLGELTNPHTQTFIAITGEMLSIPFDEDSTINFDKKCLPKVDDNCGCVFSDDSYFYNHLVIVTNKTIPNQEPLPWERKEIAAHDIQPNYIIKLANGLFPGLASVKHSKDRIFFIKSGKSITIQGTKPPIENEYEWKEMTKHCQIDAMFDLFAMHCIENNRLCRNVDLKSFSGNFPTIDKTVILKSKDKDLFRNPITPEDFHSQNNSQGELKAANSQKYQLTIRKNELKKMLDTSTGPQRTAIFAEISSINTQLNEICQRIEELKAMQPQEPRSETKLPVKVFKTFANYQMAYQLNKANLSIASLNENDIALDVPINEANPQSQIQQLFQIAFQTQSPSSYMQEIVPLYDIHINHVSDSQKSQDEFTKTIEEVCSRFGGIISRISKYIPSMKQQFGIQGSINVQIYSQTFVIPLLTLISDELCGKESVILKLPQYLQIDAHTIATSPRCPEIMREWVRNHDLHISLVRNRWIASTQTDADRAIELFESDPPIFPIRIIPIPGGINMMKLINKLKSKYRDWKLNRMRRIIVVPAKVKESEVKKLFNLCSCTSHNHNDDDEEEDGAEEFTHLGDILYCEENARLSKRRINIYTLHEPIIKNFCVSCIKTSLVNSLGRLFDEDSDSPNLIHIFQNDDLIPEITLLENPSNQFIPIGQLLVSFIHEHEIANLARTYITAIAHQILRRSPFITFCPNHPGILQRKPAMHTRLPCSCPGCRNHLCPECNKWHDSGSCPAKVLNNITRYFFNFCSIFLRYYI